MISKIKKAENKCLENRLYFKQLHKLLSLFLQNVYCIYRQTEKIREIIIKSKLKEEMKHTQRKREKERDRKGK